MLKFLIILIFTSFHLTAEYKNSNGVALEKSINDMVRWMRSDQEPIITKIEISSEWKSIDLSNNDNYAIWIGHSTFLIKKEGLTILTDPIFSDRASPFGFIGPKRLIPPAINISALPRIDVITVSHNHYDHLDISSLRKLSKLFPEALFFVPHGDKRLLNKNNIKNVHEFDWWNSFKVKNFEFTFTPVQHWSKRGLFDRNRSLWGGWHIKHNDYSIFHQIINRNSKNNTMEILFVASKLSDVNAYSSIAKKAGLNPVIMDVRCFTLKNAYDNTKFQSITDKGNSAILELGIDENYMMIIHNNTPVITDIFLREQEKQHLLEVTNEQISTESEAVIRRYAMQLKQAISDYEAKYENKITTIQVVSSLKNISLLLNISFEYLILSRL